MAAVWSFLVAGVVCAYGCFPDPPRAVDDGDVNTGSDVDEETFAADDTTSRVDSDDLETNAVDEDATDAAVAPADLDIVMDDARVEDSETTAEDATPPEVVPDTRAEVVEDTEGAEISNDSDSDSMTADIGDASLEDVLDAAESECEGDEECQHLEQSCLAGLCEDGACVAMPLSGVDCDDGDACTVGDLCERGSCRGQDLVCEAVDDCHEVGACDPETGECSSPAKPDGSGCDDGLRCTDGDACEGGTCRGIERLCQASDQCHEPGTCDPLTGFCSNPEKENFTPCDDGDPCTPDDVCSLGRCEGFGVPDDSEGDWILSLEGDGAVEIHALAEQPDGSIVVIGHARGLKVEVRDEFGTRNELNLSGYACALFRADISKDGGHATTALLGGTSACAEGDVLAAGLTLIRLADGSFVTGGHYSGGPFDLEGRGVALGTSQNGLLFDSGTWIGRLKDDAFEWVTDLLGAGVQGNDFLYQGLVADPLGPIWLATNVASEGALEVVYGLGDSEVLLNTASGTYAGYLLQLAATGRLVESSEIVCSDDCGIFPGWLSRSGEVIVMSGVARGGTITARGPTPAQDLVVPTGVTAEFEGWLVAYDDAGPTWGRALYSDTGGIQKGAFVYDAASFGTGVVATGVFSGRARSRLAGGADAPLSAAEGSSNDAPLGSYWFSVDGAGAVGSAARLEPDSAFGLAVAAEESRAVIVGVRDDILSPGTAAVEVYFASQPGVWERRVAEPLGTVAPIKPRLGGAGPASIAISDKGIVLAVNVAATATVGVGTRLTLDPPMGGTHAAIMRINSQRGLECE